MQEDNIVGKNLNDVFYVETTLKYTPILSVTMRCIVTNSYDVRFRHSEVGLKLTFTKFLFGNYRSYLQVCA